MIAEEFFRERLVTSLSPMANEYLVGVLSGFVRDPLEPGMMGTRYLGCVGPERILVLKGVGDQSLFLVGFFPDSRPVKTVGPRYYAGLGRAAYGELSGRFRGDTGRVFRELSESFVRAVTAISAVRKGLEDERLRRLEERFALSLAPLIP